MNDIKSKAMFFTFISSLIWGMAFISTKAIVDYLPPIMTALVRYIVAAIFLGIILKIKVPKASLDRVDMVRMVVTGILGISLSYYLACIALKTISGSTAGIINGTIPIFTILAQVVFFRKKCSLRTTLGIGISTIGAFFVITGTFYGFNFSDFNVGILYMVLSVMSWVAYTFFTRPLFNKYSGLEILTYQTVFAAISLIPFTAIEGSFLEGINIVLSTKIVLLNIVFLGIFCSALAYLAYNYGLEHLGVSKTSIFMNFVPVISMLGGYILFKEDVTIAKLTGLILIIISVYSVSAEKQVILPNIKT